MAEYVQMGVSGQNSACYQVINLIGIEFRSVVKQSHNCMTGIKQAKPTVKTRLSPGGLFVRNDFAGGGYSRGLIRRRAN